MIQKGFVASQVNLANEFRSSHLNSNDEADKTVKTPNWEDFQVDLLGR